MPELKVPLLTFSIHCIFEMQEISLISAIIFYYSFALTFKMTKEISRKNVVLYADDDIDDVSLIDEAFKQYSKNVTLVSVSDGFQALSYLKNSIEFNMIPCLIILDINMPRMDGKEALKKIREIDALSDVPAILFTTSSQPVDVHFANKYQAGFITKPLNYSQVDLIVNQFIDHCADDIKKRIGKN